MMKIKCPKCGSENIYEFDNDVCVYLESKVFEGRVSCDCEDCEHSFRVWVEGKLSDMKVEPMA